MDSLEGRACGGWYWMVFGLTALPVDEVRGPVKLGSSGNRAPMLAVFIVTFTSCCMPVGWPLASKLPCCCWDALTFCIFTWPMDMCAFTNVLLTLGWLVFGAPPFCVEWDCEVGGPWPEEALGVGPPGCCWRSLNGPPSIMLCCIWLMLCSTPLARFASEADVILVMLEDRLTAAPLLGGRPEWPTEEGGGYWPGGISPPSCKITSTATIYD